MKIQDHIFKYILSFILMLAALFVAADRQAVAHAAGGDRIYYFNMDDNGLEGSMMLVGSNGSWGLVDAGHRKATTIQDANGATYATNVNGLSSQVYCCNGTDVANYMINQLGVTHLDFIVGTHAHSDHVGGIPEVAAASYRDASGTIRYLVDSKTTYYYKEYQHISDLEDDLARYSSDSWHNQAFAYQAKTAMANQGAALVDVSKAQVVQGDPGNAYGDYITFTVGNMSFRLYNVHEQTNTGNENVNSIVTVMTNGNYTVVNLADINTNNGAIDYTSQAIAKDFGSVDVVVAGHHGYAGSNTKTMFDSLRPSFVVVPNGQKSSWLYTDCDLAAAIPYAQGLFGTAFYNLSISPYAVVTDLSGSQVYIYNVSGSGNLENAINKMMKSANKTGWVSWVQTNGTLWSYLEKGKSVKNAWRQVGGKWYHFDHTGIMQTGWITDGGNRFYLNGDGSMVSGWQLMNGSWYYFDSNRSSKTFGKLLTGWQKIGIGWYCFDQNGIMLANQWHEGKYLTVSGVMATGWIHLGNDWFYADGKGNKLTGWQQIGKGCWYFFDNNGYMLANQWHDGKYLTASGVMATGWIHLGNDWFYADSSGKKLTGWQQIGKGCWYFFDNNGYMQANRWLDGKYLTASGVMATGWIRLGNDTFYADSSGKKLTGWQKIGVGWYYFDGNGFMQANRWIDGCYLTASGVMATGWIRLGNDTFYADSSGKKLTGWQKIGVGWYYFDGNGFMQANQWLDGKYLTASGVMATGWIRLGNDTFYADSSGKKLTGWQKISVGWYYFDGNGYMQSDKWVDGCYLTADGVMATGWVHLGNAYYYMDGSGKKLTGWQQIDNAWYYFDGNGYMQADMWVDGCYLTASGVMATGWIHLGNDWYYADSNGKKLTGWQQIDNAWYYFDQNGIMAADIWIDGYYLDHSGVWIEGAKAA